MYSLHCFPLEYKNKWCFFNTSCTSWRDAIFLKSSKNLKTIERKLDHIEKFTHVKRYHEFDDEIPYLEAHIPILDQYLEYPFESPYPPYEEVLTTSWEPKIHLDDVIERIENIILDENSKSSHSDEQPRPY